MVKANWPILCKNDPENVTEHVCTLKSSFDIIVQHATNVSSKTILITHFRALHELYLTLQEKLLSMITVNELKALLLYIKDNMHQIKTTTTVTCINIENITSKKSSTISERCVSSSQSISLLQSKKDLTAAFKFVIKLTDADVILCLRDNPLTEILKEVNNAIARDKDIWIRTLSDCSHIADSLWTIQMTVIRQLRSSNIEIITHKADHKSILTQVKSWIMIFEHSAECVVDSFEVIIYTVCTNSIDLKSLIKKLRVFQILWILNCHAVSAWKKLNNVIYIEWLTKKGKNMSVSSLIVEFSEAKQANQIICRGLLWDDELHNCELYSCKCKLKQCFNCQTYDHIESQCIASTRCEKCAQSHLTKNCKFIMKLYCLCRIKHTAWSRNCFHRQVEKERVSKIMTERSRFFAESDQLHSQSMSTNSALLSITEADLNNLVISVFSQSSHDDTSVLNRHTVSEDILSSLSASNEKEIILSSPLKSATSQITIFLTENSSSMMSHSIQSLMTSFMNFMIWKHLEEIIATAVKAELQQHTSTKKTADSIHRASKWKAAEIFTSEDFNTAITSTVTQARNRQEFSNSLLNKSQTCKWFKQTEFTSNVNNVSKTSAEYFSQEVSDSTSMQDFFSLSSSHISSLMQPLSIQVMKREKFS